VTEIFTLRNTGNAPLTIESMQFSTPGMRARVTANIEPGESAALEVEWDTRQYTRDAIGHAVLMLNDPATPKLTLTLRGFVVSPIDVEPVPAFYLSQFAGESVEQTVTVRNHQDRDLEILRADRKGEAFTLEVEPLEPGRAYAVTAIAAADLAPGRYQQSAVLYTNDPDRPKIRLAVNILVKRVVHVSADRIDMGRVRLAALEANPSLLELLRQTLILESRSPGMRIARMESDLPFLTLEREPAGPAQRVRIDVGLDVQKLSPGRKKGTLRIVTDVEGSSEILLPVELMVVE